MTLPIVRVSEWQLRQMFNDGKYYERVQRGELTVRIRRNTHPTRVQADEPFCTKTQEVSYLDEHGGEVCRVHQYLKSDGTLGASGLPDPKRMVMDGVMYRLQKNPPKQSH